MRWSDGFVAVDWGTTNRRAWLIGADGSVAAEMEDAKGILSVPPGGFEEAVGDIRQGLGDHPMLMAGMIGSNRGWVEAPYVPCPAGIDALAANLKWVEPGRVAIVPGVCQSATAAADVMRGEEVQLLGAVASGMMRRDGLVCHPGTHNKWARIEAGRIAGFRTVMTGELFNLLRHHSILADLLARDVRADAAFEAGVRRGLDSDELLAELFSVRARVLLDRSPADEAASFTSGLLIGSDLRIGLREVPEGEVVVIGSPLLTGLFAAAMRVAGRPVRKLDGEEAFLAGAKQLVEAI